MGWGWDKKIMRGLWSFVDLNAHFLFCNPERQFSICFRISVFIISGQHYAHNREIKFSWEELGWFGSRLSMRGRRLSAREKALCWFVGPTLVLGWVKMELLGYYLEVDFYFEMQQLWWRCGIFLSSLKRNLLVLLFESNNICITLRLVNWSEKFIGGDWPFFSWSSFTGKSIILFL